VVDFVGLTVFGDDESQRGFGREHRSFQQLLAPRYSEVQQLLDTLLRLAGGPRVGRPSVARLYVRLSRVGTRRGHPSGADQAPGSGRRRKTRCELAVALYTSTHT